ncbi:MAG: class I SAM-dependent methyltransferase [Vulcanococcus sp.]|uniref:class I SAM-dependent methyltransferase n=1 Tax=Vulcanococcus sp. TaxID=2856995 RepID=UPI0025D25EC4|nr:class I SAM-dependent methyltransferase [Vulcanococcus sp.]MBW0167206.1 class I SAM-dependent methyltransferase [Vulcanococcus sp.]
MTAHTSAERLNAIGARLGGVQRYLEIGVAKGTTFFHVEAAEKHGVDPRFRFDPKGRSPYSREHYHPITSDVYFQQAIGREAPFDLIFLDGLHTYSQTLRDFLSSQALAHPRTVWMIDDTVPTDAIAADPDLQRVQAARQANGQPDDQTWMGDVFKLVAFIDSFFPQFSCFTTEGHGQTVVLPKLQAPALKRFNNVQEIDQLSYVDVLLLQDSLLRATPFEQILALIAPLR